MQRVLRLCRKKPAVVQPKQHVVLNAIQRARLKRVMKQV